MSKYTTLIRWIVEDSEIKATGEKPNGAQYHSETYKKLGLDSFPIFDELYRYTLTDKIINHYYFREIGMETVANFAWFMRRTMNEIMPYYNQLYKSENLITDPLRDRDLWIDTENQRDYKEDSTRDFKEDSTRDFKEDSTRDGKEDYTKDNINYTVFNGNTDQTVNTVDSDTNIFSDTPMSLLKNSSGGSTVKNLDYATNVTYDDSSSNTKSDTITNNKTDVTANEDLDKTTKDVFDKTTKDDFDKTTKDDFDKTLNEHIHNVKHEAGFTESQSELLLKYRETFLNIDVMIIEELKDLFMGVY